jgi:hypothetical protein
MQAFLKARQQPPDLGGFFVEGSIFNNYAALF